MQYHSTLTDKNYDTVEELEAAEKELTAKQEEENKQKEIRAERAKEVEEARVAYEEAGKKYNELLNKFLEDYHTYHYSISEKSQFKPRSIFDLLLNW